MRKQEEGIRVFDLPAGGGLQLRVAQFRADFRKGLIDPVRIKTMAQGERVGPAEHFPAALRILGLPISLEAFHRVALGDHYIDGQGEAQALLQFEQPLVIVFRQGLQSAGRGRQQGPRRQRQDHGVQRPFRALGVDVVQHRAPAAQGGVPILFGRILQIDDHAAVEEGPFGIRHRQTGLFQQQTGAAAGLHRSDQAALAAARLAEHDAPGNAVTPFAAGGQITQGAHQGAGPGAQVVGSPSRQVAQRAAFAPQDPEHAGRRQQRQAMGPPDAGEAPNPGPNL